MSESVKPRKSRARAGHLLRTENYGKDLQAQRYEAERVRMMMGDVAYEQFHRDFDRMFPSLADGERR